VDEGSKLNLNNPNVTADMLELLPRMTPAFAAAIIDWRDADSTISAGGAEAETYGRLQPPYLCKNAPFDSVDELRLVSGATLDILLGEDVNRNGIIDPDETDDDRDGVADPGILEYVTVCSREPNTRSDGSPRIRLSDRAQLQLLLTQAFNAARAIQISNRLAFATLQSPLEFYLRSGLTAEEFARIETEITTVGGPVIEGRVNVNTASAAVLNCIPGIGEDKALELVNYRLANSDTVDSVAWVTKVLTRAEAFQAGPFLTGQSYQFSADVAALGPFGRGYRRTRFIFDLSEGAPKIIYRQNLGHLGWALGRETRLTWLAKATP
jgi:DNA uptake protein ComE-like DNA-binding protein